MASKVVKMNADNTAATVADATLGDALTATISTSTFVTGGYGLLSKGLLVLAGHFIEMKTGLLQKTLGNFGS